MAERVGHPPSNPPRKLFTICACQNRVPARCLRLKLGIAGFRKVNKFGVFVRFGAGSDGKFSQRTLPYGGLRGACFGKEPTEWQLARIGSNGTFLMQMRANFHEGRAASRRKNKNRRKMLFSRFNVHDERHVHAIVNTSCFVNMPNGFMVIFGPRIQLLNSKSSEALCGVCVSRHLRKPQPWIFP
jgi:hypothetical protein